jgi:hypothetical protein
MLASAGTVSGTVPAVSVRVTTVPADSVAGVAVQVSGSLELVVLMCWA